MEFESGSTTRSGGVVVAETPFGPISRWEVEDIESRGIVRRIWMEASYMTPLRGVVTLKCYGTCYQERATGRWLPFTKITYEIRGIGDPEKGEKYLYHVRKGVQESDEKMPANSWTWAKFDEWIKERYEDMCNQMKAVDEERERRIVEDYEAMLKECKQT